MSKRDQKHFREKLDQLADRLQQDVAAVSEDARRTSGGQSSGELTNVPQHLGDMASDEFMQDMSATLLQNQEHLAAEVQAARQRLDDGRFGLCEHCGKQIPDGRLDAMPYARYCVSCAEIADNEPVTNFNSGRPQSPQDTLANEDDMASESDDLVSTSHEIQGRTERDHHAVGTAGGGMAIGGLAGTTEGRGNPNEAALGRATGSGHFDARDARPPDSEAEELLSH